MVGGPLFEKTGNCWRATSAYGVARFVTHYGKLFPAEPDPTFLPRYRSLLETVDFRKSVIVVSSEDLLKSVMIFGLLALRSFCSYEFMNAYRLIDIFLEHDEVYSCVADLVPFDVLMLYLGYGEMENVRQFDLLEQVTSLRKVQGKPTWLFFKGSSVLLEQKAPRLRDLFGQFVVLQSAQSSGMEVF